MIALISLNKYFYFFMLELIICHSKLRKQSATSVRLNQYLGSEVLVQCSLDDATPFRSSHNLCTCTGSYAVGLRGRAIVNMSFLTIFFRVKTLLTIEKTNSASLVSIKLYASKILYSSVIFSQKNKHSPVPKDLL